APALAEGGKKEGAGRKPHGGKVMIPPNLAVLPVLQEVEDLGERDPQNKPDSPVQGGGTSDNSNTQFAVLALWAAQKHGVPMDRTLYLIVKRFRSSQGAGGGWNYGYAKGGAGETPAMTCAGLVALAIGHGLAGDKQDREEGAKGAVRDEQILKGFRF